MKKYEKKFQYILKKTNCLVLCFAKAIEISFLKLLKEIFVFASIVVTELSLSLLFNIFICIVFSDSHLSIRRNLLVSICL